jgi:hypothetical protein
VVLEESVEVISFGRSVQKRVLSGFGVEKAAHGIELTEIQSENSHSTCVLWVWGWNFVTFLRCKRRTRSRVRVARFYSKGSHPKPRTYRDYFVNLVVCLTCVSKAIKGWKLPGIKKLEELGFEVVPDPTEDDPNHHVVRPGKKLIDQGHTLREWIEGRDGIDEEKKETWPPLI